MHKLLALLLVLSLLSGCAGGAASEPDKTADSVLSIDSTVQEPAPRPTELSLAYNAADALNPYKMQSAVNKTLVTLMYDSLTRPDNTYKPENQLASEVTVTGNICTVRFREGVRFSDGTSLTGNDIVYSITTAQASDTNWKNMLQNVAGCSVNEDGDVQIELRRPDADFPLLLSFPIIKEGTADWEYPTGISKFYVAGTWQKGIRLTKNPIYYDSRGAVDTVWLVAANDPDSLQFALRTGEIDLAYTDLSSADFSNLTGSSLPVQLNHLVYLGVNGNRGLLREPAFRQALSYAVNRDELIATAYVGHARATLYPMHPSFYRLQGMEVAAPRNLTQAQILLEQMGLTEKDSDGYLLQDGEAVTLRLLVNSENSSRTSAATLLSDQMRQLGIKIEIVSSSFSQYRSSLASNQYDLYIGEVRLQDNMDISSLLPSGEAAYAAPRSEALLQQYQSYRTDGDAKAFCGLFAQELPFIPLLYREGLVMQAREYAAELVVTEQDLFYNILDW